MARERAKMPAWQRAKQFAPFAALTGFEGALRQKEEDFRRDGKRTLFEDGAGEIDAVLRSVARGDTVIVIFFDGGGYDEAEGTVRYIRPEEHSMKVGDTVIEYDSIIEIRKTYG